MIKFISDLWGADILLFQEHAALGPVTDLVFAPETGELLGLFCVDPVQKKVRVIVPGEINRIIDTRIEVRGYDSLADPADMVRIQAALRIDAKIVKEKVITESGQRLGRVENATVNTDDWHLDQLYVQTGVGLNLLARELLIPQNKIIRIEKKQIVVSDEFAKDPAIETALVVNPIS